MDNFLDKILDIFCDKILPYLIIVLFILLIIGVVCVIINPHPQICINNVTYIESVRGNLTVAYLPSGEIKPC
jgi:hypothetical protein